MQNTEQTNGNSCLPFGCFTTELILWNICSSVAKEYKKENEASLSVSTVRRELVAWGVTNMSVKHNHWVPSWATLSRPARHSNVSSSLQHPMASRERSVVSTLAKPAVADVVPKSTKYGDMPSDVPRDMMR